MKIRNIALFVMVLLGASCTTVKDFVPQHRLNCASSRLPLVGVTKVHELFIVNALVNGRECRLLVDTGATHTVLDASFAESLGLKTHPITAKTNVSGGVKIAGIDTLTLGNDLFENFNVCVVNLSHTVLLDLYIDGIIGMNILNITGLQLDSHRSHSSLHPNEPMDSSVPIILEDGEVFVNAQFNGQTVRMKVDTGASDTRINTADWSSLATSGAVSTNQHKIYVDVNGAHPKRLIRELRVECRVGDVIQKNFTVSEGSVNPVYENLLGMDFIRNYIVTFDFKNGKAYFTDHTANQAEEVTANNLSTPQR